MANKWTRTAIPISKRYSPIERVAIAQEVVDYLVERTKAGNGPGNKPWSGKAGEYTKAYRESLAFRASGKGSKVNLKLSGDMISAIDIINETSGKIIVGIEGDQEGKAEGNIRGTYGSSTPKSGKARPFLGLTNSELKKILENYPIKDRAESMAQAQAVIDAGQIAQDFLNGE